MSKSIVTVSTDHVDVVSSENFEDTVRNIAAQLGRASTQELMDRLADASDWDDYASQCVGLGGPSKLIQVGYLNWGAVLTLSGVPMKAHCFIIGNPVTAQKLLAAGGAAIGLYLPTKMLVFEAPDGSVHVAYDRLPASAPSPSEPTAPNVVAAINAVLDGLAEACAHQSV